MFQYSRVNGGYRMRRSVMAVLACAVLGTPSLAALVPGDIAILSLRSRISAVRDYATGSFSFVTFASITGPDTLFFTDRGRMGATWTSNASADGCLRWIVPSGSSVAAGTVFTVSITAGPTPSLVSTPASFAAQSSIVSGWTHNVFSGGGDQIIVFKGASLAAPSTYITGLTAAATLRGRVAGGWQSAAGGMRDAATNSELPAGLLADSTALALSGARHADHLVYDTAFGIRGTRDALVALVNDSTHWRQSGSDTLDLRPGGRYLPVSFQITTPNTAPRFVGTTVTLETHAGVTSIDIRSLLHVADADMGQTLTWSAAAPPQYGAIICTGATASSGGSDIAPGGTVSYDPGGYCGTVTLDMRVSDGVATVTRQIAIRINGAPSVSVWPSASAITYGQSVGASVLSGGVAQVPGTFRFADTAFEPHTSVAFPTVIFTATDTNWLEARGTVLLLVNKAQSAVSILPIADTITWGDTLGQSMLRGGVASTEGVFCFVKTDSMPSAGRTSYPIRFLPVDTAHWLSRDTAVAVTVCRRSISITADAKTMRYGDPEPQLTWTRIDSMVGADSCSGAPAREPGDSAGRYAILPGTLRVPDNYELSFVGASFDITKRPLLVVAHPCTTTYGEADPLLTFSDTGRVGSDHIGGHLSRAPGDSVGRYAIRAESLLVGGNYLLSFVEDSLTILPRPVTIDSVTAADKEYDGLTAATVSGGVVSGKIGSDVVTVTAGSGTFTSRNAGTAIPVTASGYSLGGAAAANYILSSQPAVAPADITAKDLAVVADDQTKEVGADDPTLTWDATGFVAGESKSSMTGALSRDTGEAAGSYDISIGTLSAGPNYTIVFTKATLVIDNPSSVIEKGEGDLSSLKNMIAPAKNPVSLSDGSIDLVVLPDGASTIHLVICDAVGNVIDEQNGETVSNGSSYRFSWDLKNLDGATVAAGGYLAVAKVKAADGSTKVCRTMIGVIR